MRRHVIAAIVASTTLVLATAGVSTPASAAPVTSPTPTAAAATLVSKVMTTPRRARLTVHSAAMKKNVVVDVLLPRDQKAKRPTLYMLDGIDAGFTSGYRDSGWTTQTDIVDFMADKNVNVVLPIGGTGSYYTDWIKTDPVLGVNKWDTFLATELPPLIDKTFRGNGINALEGVSMGATGAMSLAVRHPSVYSGVVALSGCLDLLDPGAAAATRATVATRLGNPDNMWGAPGSPAWRAHDPSSNIEQLAGKPLYIAVGDGTPDPKLGLAGLASPIGGVLEAGALACTRMFAEIAAQKKIPVTVEYRKGLHSWGYWAQDLHRSWPTVVAALRLPPVDPARYR